MTCHAFASAARRSFSAAQALRFRSTSSPSSRTRRYEPGIKAGLAGSSQAAVAAKAAVPKPAADPAPDTRQIDLEDAIGGLPSSLDGDRLC